MKKYLLLIVLLPIFAEAQILQYDNTYGRWYNRIRVDSLFAIPNDTIRVPVLFGGVQAARTLSWVANKGNTLYKWNTTNFLWEPISGAAATVTGANNGLYLDGGNVQLGRNPMTKNDTIYQGGYDLYFLNSSGGELIRSTESGSVYLSGNSYSFSSAGNMRISKTPNVDYLNLSPTYLSGAATIRWPNVIGYPSQIATLVTKVNGQLADSTGEVTISAGGVDTSLLVHKSDSATFAYKTGWLKGKDIMGDVVSTTFPGPAIPTGFSQLTGAATIAYSSGLNISGGNGTFDNNYVRSTFISQSNNYQYTAEFTINTNPANHGEGLIIMKDATLNLYVRLKFATTDSCKLDMRVVSGLGNGTAFDSTTNVSMADGGTYRIIIAQSTNTIYFRLSRIVSTQETEIKDKLFTIPINTYYQLPDLGNIGVAVLGGDYTVTLLKQTNFDLNTVDVAILGTSITQAYAPTSVENHYLAKAFERSDKTFTNLGSAGGGFVDIITGLPEVYQSHPGAIGVEIGVNDNPATLRGYANAFWDSLAAHNYSAANNNVFWIKDFTNSARDSIIYNIARERNIPLVDPGLHMTAAMYQDGVHPNDSGYLFMAKFIKARLPQFFGKTGGVDGYSLRGLRDVYFSGILNGDILQYNSTVGRWTNTPTSSLGFILNQQASAQLSANAWIQGNFSANGFMGVGGKAITTAKIKIFEADNNGMGIFIENLNSASGATKVLQLVQKGPAAAEGADWNNAGIVEAVPNGGLVLDAYNNTGGIKFQTVRVTRAWLNSTGFSVGAAPSADKLEVTGNIALRAAGNKIKITTGSNASIGVSGAMTAGTITISTTAVTANSIIMLVHASVGGTQGILSVGTITAATSFVINSSSATDTGTVNWWIIN